MGRDVLQLGGRLRRRVDGSVPLERGIANARAQIAGRVLQERTV